MQRVNFSFYIHRINSVCPPQCMASDFARFIRTNNEKKKSPLKLTPRSKEVNVLRYRYRLPAQKEIPAWLLPLAAYGYRGTKARLAILKQRVSARTGVCVCINTRISGDRVRTRQRATLIDFLRAILPLFIAEYIRQESTHADSLCHSSFLEFPRYEGKNLRAVKIKYEICSCCIHLFD